MRESHMTAGYTLVEVLVASVMLTAILGTLLSVTATLRRSERFRDENVSVTQTASYAFEPMVRSLRAADALISLKVSDGCVTAKGFYGLDGSGSVTVRIQEGQPISLPVEGIAHLVTVDAESYLDPTLGPTSRWVKKEYVIEGESPRRRLREDTSIIASGSDQSWPAPLNECTAGRLAWVPVSSRYLSPETDTDTVFTSRLVIPLVRGSQQGVVQNSPFVQVSLTVRRPEAQQRNLAGIASVGTTVTPTFTYGEQRD